MNKFKDNFFVSFYLISVFFFIIALLYQGSPILGIWESLNFFNIFAPQYKFFNFIISPRANLGDVGHGTMDISRYIIEIFNLKINLFNFRIPSIFFSYLTSIIFFIICNRYFGYQTSIFVSILLITNPLYNHFQNSMTILFPSMFALLLLIERLQSFKIHGVGKSSILIIIPIYLLSIHYGVTKIYGLICIFLFFLLVFYNFKHKKNETLINYFFYFFLFIIFSVIVLTISSYKNLLILFHPIDFILSTGGENILTEENGTNISVFSNLYLNLIIILESIVNIFKDTYISNNVNLVSADFRYQLISIFQFPLFLIGLLFIIINLYKIKNKYNSIYIEILLLLFLFIISLLFSTIFFDERYKDNLLFTLSSQRMFVVIFILYFVIALGVNQILFYINNKPITYFIMFIFVIQSLYLLNLNDNKFMSILETIKINTTISQSNSQWANFIKGNSDRSHYQHLQLHNQYYNISKSICTNLNNNDQNTIIYVDLSNFANNISFPPALPYIDGFNFHLLFLSLYISDCGVQNSWYQITDDVFSKRKVGYTEFRIYSSKINKNNYEYEGKLLKHNLRDYSRGINKIILTTNIQELELAKNYFNQINLKYNYFEYIK